MIGNSDLEAILKTADDLIVVAEIYPADATPGANGFDPSAALECFADAGGVFFMNREYKRLLTGISGVKRTIEAETNSASAEFSNVTREIAEFEFAHGFEGLILVIRQFSLAMSDTLEKSLIWSVGKCEKPSSGTKKSLGITAKSIIGGADVEMPRRTFSAEDPKGRVPSDPEYEGFIHIPQYGVGTYSTRERRGGILGLFGLKHTVAHTLPYSSYSDLDANRVVPEVFGRTQLAGLHGGYIDIGGWIRIQTHFCEGEIAGYFNVRSESPNMPLNPGAYAEMVGKIGAANNKDPGWVAPGYYSRTANIRCEASGSQVSVVEPAPNVIAVVIGRLIAAFNGTDWDTLAPSDNAAAITRFCLLNEDYRNLHPNWLDDESFRHVFRFNDEILFDSSYSDFLFVPDTGAFASLKAEGNNYLQPTSVVNAEYFKYRSGDITAEEFYSQTAKPIEYDALDPSRPIDPEELPEFPEPETFPGGGTTSGLAYFLRRRYSCNVPVTQKIKLTDFLENVVFPSSRLFFSQNSKGQTKLNQKRAVDFGLATGELLENSVSIALDDVSAFVESQKGFLLIDVHTGKSEVKRIQSAIYPVANNQTQISASANIAVSPFAGASNSVAPAAASLNVTATNAGEVSSVSIDNIATEFVATAGDTVETVAGFIYASVNAHPVLKRKFKAEFSGASVTIYAKQGIVSLNEPLLSTHSAPVAAPTAAPDLSSSGGGTLKAGVYRVAYSVTNQRGQTLLSPYAEITIGDGEQISVGGVSVPAAATGINWFVGPEANSFKLRLFKQNAGQSFAFDYADLPRLSAPLPPDLNRTGAECIRVALVFSDRFEARTGAEFSRVVKSSYKWHLGRESESINQIELTFRDATQDFRQVKLVLKDEAHIKKTKVSKKEINGQAIDNFNQAYRVAASYLAEARDADFLYNLTGTREALLLEEGDVVCVTDDGAGIINQPIFLETLEPKTKPFISVSLTGRKYSTTLFDDSVADRRIPIAVETGSNPVRPAEVTYTVTNFTETRDFDPTTSDNSETRHTLATLIDDLQNGRL